MGIEPTYPAWKAGVLPLNHTRKKKIFIYAYLQNLETSRGDRIRTCDPLIPNQVHYQAVLHPEWRAEQESNPQPFDS